MITPFALPDFSEIDTPALVLDRGRLLANLQAMIDIAGDPARLRPHCKTHKMAQVTRLELELGITKHKAATIAEVELLAECGTRDVVLSYPVLGPKIDRVHALRTKYPDLKLLLTVDHAVAIQALADAAKRLDVSFDVLLDLDTGQHRSGIEPGPAAVELYAQAAGAEGVNPIGLHLYDGQNHQTPVDERRDAVLAGWKRIDALRQQIEHQGHPVRKIIVGATGSFPIFASLDDPVLELCPGTCVLHDAGYSELFPELPFQVAAMMVTRVISRPTADRITLDLGYKAVASDPPAGRRVVIPQLPDAGQVLQNEEHLVLETPLAADYQPGDLLTAVPRHICPTVALNQEAWIVDDGQLVDRWNVAARDRRITI